MKLSFVFLGVGVLFVAVFTLSIQGAAPFDDEAAVAFATLSGVGMVSTVKSAVDAWLKYAEWVAD